MNEPLLIHCVERHLVVEPNERHRRKKAVDSWNWLYEARGVTPAHYTEYKRSAKDIGDKRELPYLKDCLEFGMSFARKPEDIIFWTNDDNILHKDLPKALRRHIAIWSCCSSHRCEFHYTPMPSMDAPPSEFARARESHIGRDLFAFTKAWLVEYWDEIPDFILGASDFDLALAWIIRLKKGFKPDESLLGVPIVPCELQPGYVLHEWHRPAWTAKDNVMTAPSQLHNRKLFWAWTRKRGIKLTFDWFKLMDTGAPLPL